MAAREPGSAPAPARSMRRSLAMLAPFVFAVEFLFAWLGYSSSWVMALAIAAVVTPVTLLLVALVWPSPRGDSQDT